jgi:hypothetical protein
MDTYLHKYIHIYMHTYIHTDIRTYVYTYLLTYDTYHTYTYMIYTHTYTHYKHTHTQARAARIRTRHTYAFVIIYVEPVWTDDCQYAFENKQGKVTLDCVSLRTEVSLSMKVVGYFWHFVKIFIVLKTFSASAIMS